MSTQKSEPPVAAIRRFNRFYTRQIGVITNHVLDTPYSLTQARVLYELGRHKDLIVSTLAGNLGVDKGHMSRIVTSLRGRGAVIRMRSKTDGRRMILKLSPKGRKAFGTLNRRAANQVSEMLRDVAEDDRARLLRAMSAIEDILTRQSVRDGPVVIRTHRAGDIGWIVQRHGIVYYQEYRWDENFEALVAEILAGVIKTYDHTRDHIWIAELDGERVGSIVATKADECTAQLRLFLVEPRARGRGIGRLLLEECIRFARKSGYTKMRLWTQSVLHAARHLYQAAGFRLVSEEPRRNFGHDLVAQVWELDL
jgi:DNA-binding MarR family transcriptional regulator/GNAT superfamily N-acetyltransferase